MLHISDLEIELAEHQTHFEKGGTEGIRIAKTGKRERVFEKKNENKDICKIRVVRVEVEGTDVYRWQMAGKRE